MTLDAATRARKRSLEAELREINRFEAEDRAANPKVVGEPGGAAERKTIPDRWKTEVLNGFDWRCADCRGQLMAITFAGYPVEFDHILPLELGGEHSPDNLQPLCPPCHKAKTKNDIRRIAKAKRIAAKHFGLREPSKHPLKSRGFERRRNPA